MRDSEKKVLLITILIGIIIIGGLLLWKKKGNNTENNVNEIQNVNEKQYVQVLQDGSKVNISEELRKTKALDGLEITNIQLKENGGITTLLADVENKSGANVESKKSTGRDIKQKWRDNNNIKRKDR